MYILFRDKGWKPSDYFNLPPGEKVVVEAFLMQEMDDRKKIRGGT
nr:MAG TPA: hypothetical protein [Caudoviricetes sp.]DAZ65551.1 MAG TPA: hypothetical protein [Caudoviricetes sp.]